MNKVFIAYGTGRFRKSLKRVGKEARRLNVFSKIILYTEKDLPGYVLNSPLRSCSRGDGYWIWKPYLIWKTMQDYPNSIVVYADSGCTLQANMEEWNRWFNLLEAYDTLAFQYRKDFEYPWEREKGCGTSTGEWTKKSVIEYFDSLFDSRDWVDANQCWAGLILVCRNSRLIRSWLDIMLLHPELVVDCYGNELEHQMDGFKEHRHDQSIWSILCSYWVSKGTVVKILPETAESYSTAAVVATRKQIHPKEWTEIQIPLKSRLIKRVKKMLGNDRYNKIHSRLSKCFLFRYVALFLENK